MAVTPATSYADPPGHQVTYTVTTPDNLTATVQYMNTDPPSQAAFNANSSQYMNTVQAPFSGGQPLVYTTTLANPNQWAFVTASGILSLAGCAGECSATFTARSPWTARWW